MHEGVLKVLTQNEGYQVEESIAQGDFAEVYKAKNKWGATLALKISREPCLARLERNTPLWQELPRIGEMFSSRHLVLPCEIKNVHNHLVLVMELLEGRTLEEELAGLRGEGKKGLPAEKALIYMADVAEALAVLHAKNFVHAFYLPTRSIARVILYKSWMPDLVLSESDMLRRTDRQFVGNFYRLKLAPSERLLGPLMFIPLPLVMFTYARVNHRGLRPKGKSRRRKANLSYQKVLKSGKSRFFGGFCGFVVTRIGYPDHFACGGGLHGATKAKGLSVTKLSKCE